MKMLCARGRCDRRLSYLLVLWTMAFAVVSMNATGTIDSAELSNDASLYHFDILNASHFGSNAVARVSTPSLPVPDGAMSADRENYSSPTDDLPIGAKLLYKRSLQAIEMFDTGQIAANSLAQQPVMPSPSFLKSQMIPNTAATDVPVPYIVPQTRTGNQAGAAAPAEMKTPIIAASSSLPGQALSVAQQQHLQLQRVPLPLSSSSARAVSPPVVLRTAGESVRSIPAAAHTIGSPMIATAVAPAPLPLPLASASIQQQQQQQYSLLHHQNLPAALAPLEVPQQSSSRGSSTILSTKTDAARIYSGHTQSAQSALSTTPTTPALGPPSGQQVPAYPFLTTQKPALTSNPAVGLTAGTSSATVQYISPVETKQQQQVSSSAGSTGDGKWVILPTDRAQPLHESRLPTRAVSPVAINNNNNNNNPVTGHSSDAALAVPPVKGGLSRSADAPTSPAGVAGTTITAVSRMSGTAVSGGGKGRSRTSSSADEEALREVRYTAAGYIPPELSFIPIRARAMAATATGMPAAAVSSPVRAGTDSRGAIQSGDLKTTTAPSPPAPVSANSLSPGAAVTVATMATLAGASSPHSGPIATTSAVLHMWDYAQRVTQCIVNRDYSAELISGVRGSIPNSPLNGQEIGAEDAHSGVNGLKVDVLDKIVRNRSFEIALCPHIKWAYFHIFKCGGTTIRKTFNKLCNIHGYLLEKQYLGTSRAGSIPTAEQEMKIFLASVATTVNHNSSSSSKLSGGMEGAEIRGLGDESESESAAAGSEAEAESAVFGEYILADGKYAVKAHEYMGHWGDGRRAAFFTSLRAQNYTLFTAVRDPFEKFSSAVFEVYKRDMDLRLLKRAQYDKGKILLDIIQQMSNVRMESKVRPLRKLNAHLSPQVYFLTTANPALQNFQFVMRLEHLARDFPLLMEFAFSFPNGTASRITRQYVSFEMTVDTGNVRATALKNAGTGSAGAAAGTGADTGAGANVGAVQIVPTAEAAGAASAARLAEKAEQLLTIGEVQVGEDGPVWQPPLVWAHPPGGLWHSSDGDSEDKETSSSSNSRRNARSARNLRTREGRERTARTTERERDQGKQEWAIPPPTEARNRGERIRSQGRESPAGVLRRELVASNNHSAPSRHNYAAQRQLRSEDHLQIHHPHHRQQISTGNLNISVPSSRSFTTIYPAYTAPHRSQRLRRLEVPREADREGIAAPPGVDGEGALSMSNSLRYFNFNPAYFSAEVNATLRQLYLKDIYCIQRTML